MSTLARRPAVALMLAIAIAVVPLLAAAQPDTGGGGDGGAPMLRFVRLLDSETASPAQPFQAFDTHSANAFDLDGDGRLEIVSQNDNHRVVVIDAETGQLRAEIYNDLPEYWSARDENGVAIGDVNGNGRPDLVVVNSAGTVTVHELNGVTAGGRFAFQKLWQVTPDPKKIDPNYQPPPGYGPWEGYPSADGPAYLADVENTGRQWVFMQVDGTSGHFAIDDSGEIRWGHLYGDGNAPPIVTDLDGDGSTEAVFATDGGRVLVYDAVTGEKHWEWKLPEWPGSIPVNPAVVDLDGDGRKSILFGGRGVEVKNGSAPNGDRTRGHPDLNNSNAQFASLDPDGNPEWVIQPAWANPVIYMTPPAYDVNGDGHLDVIFLDWNTIGHKPGNWNVTGPANLFAVDGRDGSLLWRTEVHSVWSNKGVALVDLDGDGVPEVLAEEQIQRDGLSAFDAKTGAKKGHFPFPDGGWVASRGPIAVDFNGDGRVHVVVPLVRPAASTDHCEGARVNVGCREGAFAVFEAAPGAKIFDGGNHLFNRELEHNVRGAFEPVGNVTAPGDEEPVDPDGNVTEPPRFDGPPVDEDTSGGPGDVESPPDVTRPRGFLGVPAPGVMGAFAAVAVALALAGRGTRRGHR